jgi:magnesium transporter
MNKHDEIAHHGSAIEGPIIGSSVYVPGEPPRPIGLDEIGKALLNPDALVWVGLLNPDKQTLDGILEQVSVSQEVLEGLTADLAFPTLSLFDHELMLVVPTIQWQSHQARPHFGRLGCLIGERFLLTIRRGPSLSHLHLRVRLEKNRSRIDRGCDHIAVELLDDLLDRYLEAYKHFEVQVDRTERQMMRGTFDPSTVQRLYVMRRDFHRFHAAIEPIGEICARLARLKVKPLSATARLRYDGLAERISRLDGLFDSLSDGLTFAFEAGMLIEQSRQTDATKKIAAWAAIISIPTAIAGIYGMNFENMPELKWEYGYYAVLAVMATICTTLYVLFKRSKWL